jgi:glycine/D-amino acid oxidase-like deaminating enzyme
MASQIQILRLGRPVWLPKGAHTKARYPRLAGQHVADVTVIGGGMTGALTAYLFARAGVDVALVEGGLVGQGSSAASSALLLQEPERDLLELTEMYDARRARRFWRLSHDAVGELTRTLRSLRIACDLERRRTVYYARDRAGAERLRAELALRRKAGFGGTWLTPGALRDLTAVPGHGAIQTDGGAQFDPYRACVGVMDAASAAGARVYERSFVTRYTAGRRSLRLYLKSGTIDTRHVIVATGYASPHFRPLVGRFEMFRTYVVATERLTAAQRREVGLSDVMLRDTARPYHCARWTRDGRLLLSGGDQAVIPGRRRLIGLARATEHLRDHFEERLPGLAGVGSSTTWEGLFALTPDSMPYIGYHRRYPHHSFALGYGGNGMTFAHLCARMLLEQWQGHTSPDHALFAFDRHAR